GSPDSAFRYLCSANQLADECRRRTNTATPAMANSPMVPGSGTVSATPRNRLLVGAVARVMNGEPPTPLSVTCSSLSPAAVVAHCVTLPVLESSCPASPRLPPTPSLSVYALLQALPFQTHF